MKTLTILDDYGLGLADKPRQGDEDYVDRHAARAIVFNDQGQIALLHATNFGYHKLPGGGLEDGEQWQDAILREAQEETGCLVQLRPIEIGQIIEFRGRPEIYRPQIKKLKQISQCGVADVIGHANLELTDEEIRVGLVLQWVTLDQAIDICEQDVPTQDEGQPDNYEGRFIRARDLIFLKKAKEVLE